MEFWQLILLQILTLLALAYFYVKHRHSYWSRRGINGPAPTALLGTILEPIRRGQLVTELEWAKKYGKIYGTYIGLQPVLAINDPALIKQVMIKDFHVFVNRRRTPPVASKHLFNLHDDEWKRMRAITSPTFTSGKLRGMNALMNRCIGKLSDYFEKISIGTGTGVIDTKAVISGFTIDVIASTSFATETNANGDRSVRNPFLEHGLRFFRFTPIRLFIPLLMPDFVQKFVNKFIPQKDALFFIDLSKEVVRQRRAALSSGDSNGAKRNDFVQLLMDARVTDSEIRNSNYDGLTADADKDDVAKFDKTGTAPTESMIGKQRSLEDDEIVAQCFLFFVAGFETTASTISHCLFELARSPAVQNRLVQELAQKLPADCAPESDAYHDTIMTRIPYLDAVIKETLRKYPPVPRLDRCANENGYILGDLKLEKGQQVSIGAYAVHHNPEYYPDPERFDPDRFMPENRHLLTPYTYMPFGQGPRNCVAMRFAYQEIKLCLARLLPRYRFAPTPDTPDVLRFSKIGLMSVEPFKLAVSRRA